MSAPRVIVVEDEALVALMMEDLLTDLGCEVVASFGGLEPALAWVKEEGRKLDGALLDINLGGEMVFPLAAMLQENDVPFAFATGYGNLKLEERFQKTPLLTKPMNPVRLREVVRSFAAAG